MATLTALTVDQINEIEYPCKAFMQHKNDSTSKVIFNIGSWAYESPKSMKYLVEELEKMIEFNSYKGYKKDDFEIVVESFTEDDYVNHVLKTNASMPNPEFENAVTYEERINVKQRYIKADEAYIRKTFNNCKQKSI